MSLKEFETVKRKSCYFTDAFFSLTIKELISTAEQLGFAASLYVRMELGEQLCYLSETIKEVLETIQKLPQKRREAVLLHAIFYHTLDRESLKKIINQHLDDLEWDEQTDFEGKPVAF